jgi:hypothetical protein
MRGRRVEAGTKVPEIVGIDAVDDVRDPAQLGFRVTEAVQIVLAEEAAIRRVASVLRDLGLVGGHDEMIGADLLRPGSALPRARRRGGKRRSS